MTLVLESNKSCLYCPAPEPKDVVVRKDGDVRIVRCEKCDTDLLYGLVSHDGQMRVSVPPWFDPPEMQVGAGVSLGRWELWWSTYSWVGIIHGKVADGDSNVADMVDAILPDKYGRY